MRRRIPAAPRGEKSSALTCLFFSASRASSSLPCRDVRVSSSHDRQLSMYPFNAVDTKEKRKKMYRYEEV